MIRLTVDGRPVTVDDGATLLDAVRASGSWVPALCAGASLPTGGGCRLCAVRLVDQARPMPACRTAAAPRMVVRTDGDALHRARAQVVRLLLADHPAPCRPPGDPRGECELEALARRLRLPLSQPPATSPSVPIPSVPIPFPPDTSHPALHFHPAACVECGRCIRACGDIQGHHVIGWHGAGITRTLAFSGQKNLADSDCVACGQCLAACPTGALLPALAPVPGMTAIDTICPYCGVGCGITCHVAPERDGHGGETRGRIHAVTSQPGQPANRGRLCVKGRFGLDFVTRPERLTQPLMRRPDAPKPCGPEGFEAVPWDTALERVATTLLDIAQRHGGHAVGGLGSAKCTNEDNYLFQKWLRAGLFSPNVDHCARLCHSSSVAALGAMLGSGAGTNPNTDFLLADAIFLIGTNTLETHPVIATFIRQAHAAGASLVVADPRRIGLAHEATVHLQHRPGSDPWLVAGLAREILNADLADNAFIAAHTEGFEAYRAALLALDMAEVGRVTGVPRAAIRHAAHHLGGAKNLLTAWGMGLTQHVAGTINCAAVAGLALLTGNLGRPGAGVNPLRGQNNVQGASDMGVLPNVLPGYQPVTDSATRARFGAAWGRPLPETPGLTVVEMLRAAADGDLRAMHIMGENPALSDPDLEHVHAGLTRLEFLAVQDVFFTQTCAWADVILPAASVLERAGSVTSTERRVQRTRPVLPPPGAARADGDILAWLLERAQVGGAGSDGNGDAAAVMAEMARLTPLYRGLSARRLERESVCWPCPAPDHPGTPILHAGGPLRGRARFVVPLLTPPAETPDATYPFILTTGRLLEHYQTGTLSRRSAVLDELVPGPWATAHPDTLSQAGVTDGATARISTRRGEMAITLRADPEALPGVIFVPNHFAEAPVNRLIHDQLDPEAKIPEYKCVAAALSGETSGR